MSISNIKPVGMGILVEILDPQTVMGTSLHLSPGAKSHGECPQGIILAFGSKFEPLAEEYGLSLKSRVVLVGTFTPMPKCDAYPDQEIAIIDWSAIKAVLEEDS